MEEANTKTSKAKKEPKVEIFGNTKEKFGEEFDDRFHHRHHHGSLTWGLAFILIGLMFLLSNFGALPPVVWGQVVRLWPILIVLIGIDTLIGHSEVSDLVNSLIGLFIFATILGVVFLNVSPTLLRGFPEGIQNYLTAINHYLLIK